jgi:hypothetical protein
MVALVIFVLAILFLFLLRTFNVMLNDPFGKGTPIPEWHFDSPQPSQSTECDSA